MALSICASAWNPTSPPRFPGQLRDWPMGTVLLDAIDLGKRREEVVSTVLIGEGSRPGRPFS